MIYSYIQNFFSKNFNRGSNLRLHWELQQSLWRVHFVTMEAGSNGVRDGSLICQSSGKLRSSSKKYIGVKKCVSGRFSATITVPKTRKRRGLGTYDTAEEAAAAFDLAAKLMRGTKARTNSITLDPFKPTWSGATTLSRSAAFSPPFSCKRSDLSSSLLNKPFNARFLSKPSNPNNPFLTSLFNLPFQKQDKQVFHFESSSTILSSPLPKFRAANQDISAFGHPVSTNNFTLSCSAPCTQSLQVPSSPKSSTLNNISTTPSLSNLGFPSQHSFLPHEENPQIIPTTQSLSNPVFSPMQRFLPHVAEPHTISSTPFLPIPELSLPQYQQCSNTVYSASTMNKSTSTVQETISNTQSLQNPVFLSIHMSLPCVDEISSTPQSQQFPCTTIPCTSIHSTSGLFKPDFRKGLYDNQNEQQCNQQYGIETELNNTQLPGLCEWSADSQLCSITQSHEECRATIDDAIGLSNLGMEKGLSENQNEKQCIKQYDIEQLSWTQLADLCPLPTGDNLYHIPQSQKCSATHSTIPTTQSLPNPMFPSHNVFIPHEEELFSVLQSQQCSTSTDCITIQSTTGLSNLNMQQKGIATHSTISTTQPLPNPMFPSHHNLCDPHEEHLSSILQSQQGSISTQNTTGLSNLNMQWSLYENKKEQLFSKQYDIEKELRRTKLPGFECSADSQLSALPQSQQCDTTIHCTTGLSNLNKQEGTKQDDLEKELQYEIELNTKESLDLEECFTESMTPDADFLLENIPGTTFPSLDNIWDWIVTWSVLQSIVIVMYVAAFYYINFICLNE